MTDDVLFRALVEQSRDHAIFLIDSDGRNLTWGVGVERLLGYTRDEFIGHHTREIFTTEDREAGVPERELAFAASHGAASDERWLERKDGSRFWASGMTYRLQDAAEQVTGFAKIFRDLTMEREFESDLRAHAERYRLATRAADEALWDRDLNTDTVTWTDGFEEVFGYGPAQLGKDVRWWEQRIHPEDRARITDSVRRAVRSAAERWEEEYRFRRCDGEYVRVRDCARIMRTTDGVPLRMLGAMADVSRQRQTEEALRQSQQLAALGRLAGGVAHDLNNMLMAIIGYTEMLDRGFPAGDPRRRDTAEVLASARRSADLTRKLLAFAQREVTRPIRLDVNKVIAGATGRLRTLVGPTVELRLQLGLRLPQVEADPSQLEQVLTDLARAACSPSARRRGGSTTARSASIMPGAACRRGTTSCSRWRTRARASCRTCWSTCSSRSSPLGRSERVSAWDWPRCTARFGRTAAMSGRRRSRARGRSSTFSCRWPVSGKPQAGTAHRRESPCRSRWPLTPTRMSPAPPPSPRARATVPGPSRPPRHRSDPAPPGRRRRRARAAPCARAAAGAPDCW
jgi:PAS domain S-box-containing protein